LDVWRRGMPLDVPRAGYAPSEFQKKPWSEEALIEGWFPPLRRGQMGFDVVEDANAGSSKGERQSSALADGSDASCGRVTRDPGRTRELNPDKPRRTCRQGADASVEEGRRRSGEICLDTSFHRRRSNAGRTSVAPMNPSSTYRSTGRTWCPSARARSRSALTWLSIVACWACCSEDTRAYRAMVFMQLSPSAVGAHAHDTADHGPQLRRAPRVARQGRRVRTRYADDRPTSGRTRKRLGYGVGAAWSSAVARGITMPWRTAMRAGSSSAPLFSAVEGPLTQC
jgi:hypothetical protein